MVGCELAEVDIWRDDLGGDAPMIRLDIDPAVLAAQQRPQDRLVLGEAYETMEAVLDAVEGCTPAPGWSADEIAKPRAQWRSETDAERPGIVPLCDAKSPPTR